MKGSSKSRRRALIRNRVAKKKKRDGETEYNFQIRTGTKEPHVSKVKSGVNTWNLSRAEEGRNVRYRATDDWEVRFDRSRRN